MNYINLLNNVCKKTAKLGIIGANGGFGYTFLNQIASMEDKLSIRLICDRDISKSISVLSELGYDSTSFIPCHTEEEVKKADKIGIIILDDGSLAQYSDVDIIVEATGLPETSSLYAEQALLSGKNVCMVSKEADCISGPYLYQLAKQRGLVYSIVIGDQPGNLINFLSWIQTLGMKVVCAGKSSEYDFVYDRQTKVFSYRGDQQVITELDEYWEYKGTQTLEERSRILKDYPQFSVGDYCEMNVIANATGLVPSCPSMHYPICNPTDLVRIYIPKEDGGILDNTGVLDVFNDFIRPDEVSFSGGIYVIVTCDNPKVWEIIADKGHIVSKNRKYACLYLPYHFMGVEAPMSPLLMHYLGMSTYPDYKEVARMVCITARDFKAGETLIMKYERRHIEDTEVTLLKTSELDDDVIPYYMAAEKTFLCDVPKGTVVRESMLDLSHSFLKRMRDTLKNGEIK